MIRLALLVAFGVLLALKLTGDDASWLLVFSPLLAYLGMWFIRLLATIWLFSGVWKH